VRALLALLTLLTLSPALAGPLSTEDRRRALLFVDLLIDDGKLDEAEKFLAPRLKEEPRAADWGLRLARLRGAQRRYGESREQYRALLKAQPNDPGLWLAYGEHSQEDGDYGEARTAYEKARSLSKDPRASYHLGELAFSRGDALEGRRFAREALSLIRDTRERDMRRLELRIKARIEWHDGLEDAFGKLYDENPGDAEALAEWAHALLRQGRAKAAREPVALMKERFPKPEERWRLLELERLQVLGDKSALEAFARESAAALPENPAMRHALADFAFNRRDWEEAEREYEYCRRFPAHARQACQMYWESVRQGWHSAGPYMSTRQSVNTRLDEAGMSYRGYPWKRWRVEAEASRMQTYRFSTGRKTDLTGGAVSLIHDAPSWSLGADLDARVGSGRSYVSPGVIGWLRLSPNTDAALRAWTGRAADSVEPMQAGVRADSFQGRLSSQVLRRLTLSGFAQHSRMSVPNGARAEQTELVPEASWSFLTQPVYPLYLNANYRYVSVDARGQDAFFRALPLLRRSRIHYATLSFGKRWLCGRLRADGYVFNGHEPNQGRRFGTEALIGFGARLDWLLAGPWRIAAAYDHTKEDQLGIGGRSDSARVWVQYRWAPRRANNP
jgi:tetratricopeptide (TPR) repeat protein